MAFVPVKEYQVDWAPSSNQNRIAVLIGNNPTPFIPPINTESEFLALFMMLQKQGVTVDTQTGNFQVPRRPAGT